MAVTHNMLPPANGATTKVNGRTYSAAAGTVLTNVPDFDRPLLEANGWITASPGGAGATTARPVNPPKWTQFHDSTLGFEIIWDGKAWRNPDTGAAV